MLRVFNPRAIARLLLWLSVAGLSIGCNQQADTQQAAGNSDTLPEGSHPAQAVPFASLVEQAATPDMQVDRLPASSGAPGLLLILSQQAFAPAVIAAPGQGITPLRSLRSADLDIVLGSGFSTEPGSLKPVGLLKIDGNELNPLEPHGYTRILGITGDKLAVSHRKAYRANLFESALQLGPGVIEDGQLDISERDLQRRKYQRSFVAVCRDHWLLGITTQPTNLYTLGQALLAYAQRNKLQCAEMINMAGDQQAVLAVKDADGNIVYRGHAREPKVSLIGFRRRL